MRGAAERAILLKEMPANDVLIVDDNEEFAGLLGTLIAEQGLRPILAHKANDAIALAAQYPPAAIILDLLLPDMTGHKLLSSLKSAGDLPPIFVVTGVFKGPAQVEKVSAIVEVAGWHEKPFDARILVDQIVEVVAKKPSVERGQHKKIERITPSLDIDILDPIEIEGIRGSKRAEASRDPLEFDVEIDSGADLEVAVDEDALLLWDVVDGPMAALESGTASGSVPFVEDEPTEPYRDPFSDRVLEGLPSPRSLPGPGFASGSLELSVELELEGPIGQQSIAPPVREVTHEPEPEPEPDPDAAPKAEEHAGTRARDAPRSSFPVAFSERSPLAEQMRTGLRAKIRSGQLKPATVPRLLTAFFVARETGEIAFERGAERKVVYFSSGRPAYARSNQDEDRLGAIAQKTFGLTQAQIEAALGVARKTDRMLGSVLIEQGLIGEHHRAELVRAQTRTIIQSVLTWTDGRYVIGFNVAEQIERAELDEHPAALVLNSVRELFDLDRLRRLVPDRIAPMPSSNPPYELHELPLNDPQALLLLRATGKRSVAALIDELASRLDEHGVRASLHGLLALGVLIAGQSSERVSAA